MKTDVFRYIELFHNRKRLKDSLEYMSPAITGSRTARADNGVGSTVTEEKTGEMFPSVVYVNERAKTLTIPQNTEEAIKSLYTDALNLCKSGSKVLVPKNDYNVIFLSASVSEQVDGRDKIQEALEKKLEEMRYDDDLLFVENTADANDVYLVFLTYIESLTDYSMDLDPNYDFEKMNRMKSENFLFCA